MSKFTLFPTQLNHALKTRKIMYLHKYKADFFVDIFDNVSVIIPQVKSPLEIWGQTRVTQFYIFLRNHISDVYKGR